MGTLYMRQCFRHHNKKGQRGAKFHFLQTADPMVFKSIRNIQPAVYPLHGRASLVFLRKVKHGLLGTFPFALLTFRDAELETVKAYSVNSPLLREIAFVRHG